MSPLALRVGLSHAWKKVLYGDELILFAICHLLYTMSVKKMKTVRLLVRAAVESRPNKDALKDHFLLMSSLSNLADNAPLEKPPRPRPPAG